MPEENEAFWSSDTAGKLDKVSVAVLHDTGAIMRAYQAHLIKTFARMTFWTLMPSSATTANTMIWLGKESITSTTRMISSSVMPRK